MAGVNQAGTKLHFWVLTKPINQTGAENGPDFAAITGKKELNLL